MTVIVLQVAAQFGKDSDALATTGVTISFRNRFLEPLQRNQRLDGREGVDVQPAQRFHHRVLLRLKKRHLELLGLRRDAHTAAERVTALAALFFQITQNLFGALDHRGRQARHTAHLNPVALVRAARENFTQPDDPIVGLFNGDAVVFHIGELLF